MEFAKLERRVVEQVAKLHIEGIKNAFISSLGINFVTALYEAIAQSRVGFGFVAEKDDKVFGFIAFTTNLNKLYKSVIFKSGLKFIFMLAGKMLSFQRIERVLETLFYPNRIKKMDLPNVELLSIVVAPESQGEGLGRKLLQKGLAECAKRNIDKVKVLVGSDNPLANKLYLRCGFELVGRIENHGILCNIYVADTGKSMLNK